MFSISRNDKGDVVITGRFDASRVDEASVVLDAVTETCRVDMAQLEYISSAGLGTLLKAQKRLNESGHGLILVNTGKMVRDVFKIARFDLVFQMVEDP
jgi:anti-sigma B factor antagonist